MSAKPLILTVLTGGGFAFETTCLLQSLAGEVELIYLNTVFGGTPGEKGVPPGEAFPVPSFASVTQPSRLRSVRAFCGTYAAARRVLRARPVAVVVVVGCSHAVPVFLAARLARRPTVYIESITRTTHLSNTGKLVRRLGLATRYLVQWPGLQAQVPGSQLGTIL